MTTPLQPAASRAALNWAPIGAALAAAGVQTVIATADIADARPAFTDHQVHVIVPRHPEAAAALALAHARFSPDRVALLLTGDSGLSATWPQLVAAAVTRIPLLVLLPSPPAGPAPAQAWAAMLDELGVVMNLPDRGSSPGRTRTVIAEAADAAETCLRPLVVHLAPPGPRRRAASPRSAARYGDLGRGNDEDNDHGDDAADDGIIKDGESDYSDRRQDDKEPLSLPDAPTADPEAIAALTHLLAQARRPVFIAGRGASDAAATIEHLAEQTGALLATTAASYGLFTGNPWHIGIAGALSTPDTAEMIRGADIVVAVGCSLDAWTTRTGTLLGPGARLAQIDIRPEALGLHQVIHLGIAADAAATVEALIQALQAGPPPHSGYRTTAVRARIAAQVSWHDIGYQPLLEFDDRIDPRTLSLLLDSILPAERTLIVEEGSAMAYPLCYLRIPDARSYLLAPPNLGLASGIGAALARPGRLTVIALDLDSYLSSAADLQTAAQVDTPLLIVVYDDNTTPTRAGRAAPADADVDPIQIAAGYGCAGAVVTRPPHLSTVTAWLAEPHPPLILHAHVTHDAWWLDALVSDPAVSEARP